jgi:hypothetical protein
LDEIYAELFTGYQLRVVCKCSEHFEALIEAYKKQRNIKQDAETIEKLGQCMKTVQDIEREVKKALMNKRWNKLIKNLAFEKSGGRSEEKIFTNAP